MATGITKNTTIIGVKEEATEGTYEAPGATTDYIQPLADGFELSPAKELIERNILTNSVGKVTPRTGTKSVSGALPCEFRASGTEGGDLDFAVLLKGALGAKRSIASRITTKSSGNTGSNLKIEDADIGSIAVGDIFIVLESGDHHLCVVTARDATGGAANVTISPAKSSGSFSNSVVISKSQMYYTSSTGHPHFSASYYWANEIVEKAIGCMVTGLSLDNFQTGQVASFNFTFEGLSFDEANGAAAHTPAYDSGLPPLILNACLFMDGTDVPINNFGLQLQNTLAFKTTTCSSNGRTAARVVERVINGSFNPYKDDTAVTNFTKFNANTAFSLFIRAYIPSSTTGEIELGSAIGIYLPNCIITEKKNGDLEGLLVEDISFQATRGSAGTTEEMYLGFI